MVTRTDEEQVEALQRWWRENGRSVIAALILAVAGVIGYQQWQSYQARQAASASAIYSQLQATEDAEEVSGVLTRLKEEYDDSPYAVLAAMSMAQQHVSDGALDKAAEELRWAREHASDETMSRLASMRLARVLWAQEQYQQAAEALGEPPEEGFEAEYHELRGDILSAQTQKSDAAEAYRKALNAAGPMGQQRRQLLQMKLEASGGAAAQS